MNKNLAVIILAAGKGTRMKSDLPKVLHKIAGKTMLTHVIDAAKRLDPAKIIVVVSPNSAEIEKEAKDCAIAVQQQQLGTGDAVKAATALLKDFSGDVLVLYGDCPLITTASIMKLFDKPLKDEIRMFGFETADPAKYGRLITNKKTVLEIIEFRDATEEQRKITLCNSGIYYLSAKNLSKLVNELKNDNAQKEYYLTDIIKNGWHHGLETNYYLIGENEISGVNDKIELSRAEHAMQKHLRDRAMLEGVTMLAPDTIFLSCDTKFGRNVTLRQHVVIGENVTIGDNVAIGPFAHIRPNTVIGNNVSIGNFVEIKKSKIGNHSKVNHLSYVGDSTIGSNVNIGAGVITCNYDGFDKNETKIEDGVFVGSNSALIAPVTIGKDAMIAAGSVISKDVSSGALGIARSLQKNLADWAFQFRKAKK